MRFTIALLAVVLGMFLGTLLALEIGRRIGVWRFATDPASYKAGVGVAEGVVFGVLALLLGFTFNGAAQRFDARRELIIAEVVAVRTAWLRIDLLPQEAQPPIRDMMRRYLDAQLAAYAALPNVDAATRRAARAVLVQAEIWDLVAAASQRPGGGQAGLLLTAVNEIVELGQRRILATRMHPPRIIFALLAVAAFASALLLGYGMGNTPGRNWTYMLCFAATIAMALLVILNLEYPRLGFVSMGPFDRALADLRTTMD